MDKPDDLGTRPAEHILQSVNDEQVELAKGGIDALGEILGVVKRLPSIISIGSAANTLITLSDP